MYVAIVKLTFDPETSATPYDHKDLVALVEKIRKRFRVCVSLYPQDDERPQALVLTALGSHQQKLSQLVDSISEFCESQGIGRIASEDALVDHVDAIFDDHGEGDQATVSSD